MKNSIFNAVCKTRYLALLVVLIFTCGNVWGAIAYGTYVEASALESGAHYIFTGVKNSTTYTISNVNNTNNRKTTSVSINNNGSITVASNSTVCTFTLGGSSDAWTWCADNYLVNSQVTTNCYLRATSSSSNNLGLNSNTLDNEGKWTMGFFSSGTATMVANGKNTRKKVRFNPNGNNAAIFGAYATGTTTGTDVKFYRKAVQGASNNTNYGTVSVAGDVITATPKSGYQVSTSNPYTISPTGKATVSQSGNVFTLTNVSAVVTLTVNFEAAAPSCDKSVTLAQSVTNGTATFDPTGPVETCSETASDRQVSVSITPTTGYELTSGPTVSGVTGATISGSGPYTIQLPKNGNGELTLSATCSAISVTGVSLNKNSTTIAEGSTETLTATITPSNALDQAVTWSSNAPGVATVSSSGVVTAESAGNATITVTTHDGSYTATCTVTVTAVPKDHFIDEVQGTIIADKTSAYNFSSVTISDKATATSGTCEQVHYHFVGWITKAKYDAGTAIGDGDIQSGNKTPNNSTYYAVWAKEDAGGGEEGWFETGISDLTEDDVFVIVGNNGSNYAMTNDNGTSSAPSASSVSISTGKITSIVNDNMKWNISGNSTDGYIFYPNGSTETWLYCTNTNNGVRLGSNDNKAFSINSDYLYNTATSRYVGIYNSQDWRCYTSINANIENQTFAFYAYDPGVSYTDYIASCGAEYNITLDKNGGSTDGSAVVTANATVLNSGFTAPVYAGHQVDYYMVDAAAGSTKIAEADGTLAANVTVSSTPWTDANGKWVKGGDATFYAKWKATECVITLNNEGADSGHEGTASVTATYGASTNLTSNINIPSKNGYTFGGYYTAAGGSGTKLINADGSWIASAAGYTNASKQWQLDATALELHAEWILKTYTVTWVVNGTTEATQTNVNFGTRYDALTQEPSVDDDALSSCGSDKFIGWVTQEYTAEGGTKVSQYDPYAVTSSTAIDDTHYTFYAMFAKEEGTAFSLSVTSGDFKISGLVDGVNYYATGALSSGKYGVTTTASDGDLFTFTKVNDGVYTIYHKRSSKYVKWSSSTNFKEEATSENWTITSANHGSWSVVPETATNRAFIMCHSANNPENNNVFKPYASSNVTGTPSQYYYIEIGTSNLTNYRTGCCSEKITLSVSDATSGVGGTVTLKWNNADKSAGDQVSTCSAGTLVAKVTANPGYILTAMAISGTNKSITITPSDLTTGLPSTEEMTYSVAVQALATGTLTITPTFSRTYTVTYDLAGGETSGSTATVRYQSGEQVTLVTPDPTKSGYNFSEWNVTKEGGGNVTVSNGKFTMPTDNVTVTATWTEKTLTSISLGSASVEVYVGQYVEIPVIYDPADILTKNYTLVANPSYCATTGSTITTLKITGGRGGVTITENKTETVSIKANADNSKTASVSVTVKPLPVDHYVDLIHGVSFDDKGSTIVNNELSATYTAPGYGDYSGSTTGDCETNHLHLVGWIDSEWADAHPKASHAEIIAAEGYHTAREAGMTASNKTYYAVWGDEQ